MDSYDYERLRARAVGEKGDQKDHYLVMAFDELQRQGIVHFIDYAAFYSNHIQQQYLRQNRALLENLSKEVHQQAALTGIEEWTRYARGSYQESFRTGLGEDVDSFTDLRQQEQNLRQNIERGTSDPVRWNEKLLNKAVAALAVREAADDALDCGVDRVVAGSEHQILQDFLDTCQSNRSGSKYDKGANSHLERLSPSTRIAGIDPTLASQTRTTLNTVGEIAVTITGVQHDDWIVLGPTFALPQYYDLFEDFEQIQREIRRDIDVETLAAETKTVLATLEQETDELLSPTRFQYEVGWVAEQTELFDNDSQQSLSDLVEYTLGLSNYSRELRAMADRGDLSQAAIFLGASMASNPIVRNQNTDIHRRALELTHRLAPSSIDGQAIEPFRQERSAKTWNDHTDWYETMDRVR